PLEGEDVVVRDRTGAEDHRTIRGRRLAETKKAPRRAPWFWGDYAARRRAERRRARIAVGLLAGWRDVSSLACSSLVAVRAMVLNDPLKIRSVLLATSPTTSPRRACSFTMWRPLTAIFSGSLPLTSMPKTVT